MNRRVTMRDVAALASTSSAVVSYVVNNGPRAVTPETRDRVLRAIEISGYQPDRLAQGLARGTSGTYGLLVPDITNPFFASLALALEDELFALGHSLLLGSSAEDVGREAELVRRFLQYRVDALFFVGVDAALNERQVAGLKVPVIVLDRQDDSLSVGSVTVDNVAAARAATEHLLEHGRRSIAHIAGPAHLQVAQDRRHGYEAAMADAELSHAVRVVAAPFSKDGGLEAGRQLLREVPRPDSVFVSNEQQAIGVLRAAAEAGLSVPRDLSVIAIDGTRDSEFTSPPLTCVAQPIALIAREAIRLLSASADEHRSVEVPFELVVRDSCGEHATPPAPSERT